MSEYSKIKDTQAEQLGSIDKVHPMKMITVMSGVQIIMLLAMGISMWLIGISV